LDWLAQEFVRQGWSIKAMHRLLMTSTVYRQSSARTPVLEKRDPENRLLSRMPLRRMEADVLYDALLQVGNRLDLRPFGAPDPVDVRPDGLVIPIGTERGWRRSVYVLQRRKELPTLLENFDFPQMTLNCVERTHTTVALQALNLMNDSLVRELADAFACRVAREAGAEASQRIERAYWIALSRPPTPQERGIGLRILAEMTEAWARHDQENAADRALATFCHAVLNSAAFLAID